MAFQYGEIGLAAAVSIIMLVILLVFTFIYAFVAMKEKK
jgi:ABC-type sugar transport system permease subunit